jgi:hypothetical protein
MATHYVARELLVLGHDVRQVPQSYAKPFRQGHKNDFRDACAIAEAVQRPSSRVSCTQFGVQPLPSPAPLERRNAASCCCAPCLEYPRNRRLRYRLSSEPPISRSGYRGSSAGSCWDGNTSCRTMHRARGFDENPSVRAHEIPEGMSFSATRHGEKVRVAPRGQESIFERP